MPKKKTELITSKQIEQDIINSLNYPMKMTKAEYKNPTRYIIAVILAVLFFAFLIYYLPRMDGLSALLTIFGLMLAFIVWIVIMFVSAVLIRKHKQNNVRIDNYEVTTEVIYRTDDETYTRKVGRGIARHSVTVINYILYFENGKSWQIPPRNYTWSEELQMPERMLFENANRGDTFIVVTEKRSGNIAMVYPTKFFKYNSK